MRWGWVILTVIAVVILAGGVFVKRFVDQAEVGAAAMAKVVCSCVFVDGRELGACRADDPPGFEGVAVTIDAGSRSATGSIFGLVNRRATYSEATGCTLEP